MRRRCAFSASRRALSSVTPALRTSNTCPTDHSRLSEWERRSVRALQRARGRARGCRSAIAPDAGSHALLERFGIEGAVQVVGALVMDRSRHVLFRRTGHQQQSCGDQNSETSHAPSVSIGKAFEPGRAPIAGASLRLVRRDCTGTVILASRRLGAPRLKSRHGQSFSACRLRSRRGDRQFRPRGCDLVHTRPARSGLRMNNGPHLGGRARRLQMAAIARALWRDSTRRVDVETLKTIGMFCGAGLAVSLLLVSYGLDPGPGFF